MHISILGGVKHVDDTMLKEDNIYCWFKANGAISIGAPVALDESATTDYTGCEVIEADGDNPYHLCRGIYNWQCDTGLKHGSWESLSGVNAGGSAVSGTALAGFAAADGDWIGVQTYGVGVARVNGDAASPGIARGDPLVPQASPVGALIRDTQSPEMAGVPARAMFTALRASEVAAEVGIQIDIACM